MNATATQATAAMTGINRSRLWYAPHPHLRSATAATDACRTADRISAGPKPDPASNEQSLFLAMHTCAYRATGRSRAPAAPPAEREQWTARWQTIHGHIVERNLGLAHSMVGRFSRARVDHDDLLSEAMFGLVRAVDRYNPWRGYRFSTYACNVIIRALMRRFRNQGRYQQRFPLLDTESFDRPKGVDSDDGLYIERLKWAVKRNAAALTEVESRVLAKRFPSNADSPLTFRQISKVIGLSRERVRQIEGIALRKLRMALQADPVLQ
jgi:RNA polymerase primary sigma factor